MNTVLLVCDIVESNCLAGAYLVFFYCAVKYLPHFCAAMEELEEMSKK